MTIQANQGFGVSIFGATSAGGGGSTSPGGSSGQLQYNASGSFGGMAGTSWDDTNRSLTLTGATVTTSQPVLNLSQTWNAGAVTFTGLKFNATDTASAAGSLLLDLQVGGASKFKADKAGSIYLAGGSISRIIYAGSGATNFSILTNHVGVQAVFEGGSGNPMFTAGAPGNTYPGLFVMSGGFFGFYNSNSLGATPDIYLSRDAANTLALRNGANAQNFRVYNTYTDASNNGYCQIAFAGGNCYIGSVVNGTGSAGGLIFQSNNLTCWSINTAGHLSNYTDNTYDLGRPATNGRVRTIYSGGGYSAASPTTKTADYTQGTEDFSLIFNGSGSINLTLLAAATYPGKVLHVKTIAAQTVVSASSNVCPVDSSTAGTAILPATAGAWAMLQSDGTNWIIMAKG